MFMVLRNEDKYRKRAKARRNRTDWPIFRPDLVYLIADARRRLVAAGVASEQRHLPPPPEEEGGSGAGLGGGVPVVYVGDRAVPGLGKNYMTEDSRREGVEVYTLHLRRYALRGLLARLEAGIRVDLPGDGNNSKGHPSKSLLGGVGGRMPPPVANGPILTDLLTRPSLGSSRLEAGRGGDKIVAAAEVEAAAEAWELQRSLLVEEFGGGKMEVEQLMKELIQIEEKVARDVEDSKGRDDKRGAQVIPGYADAHIPAKQEAAVKLAISIKDDIERKAHAVLSRL
ncbi:unnamed protein product [Discosporangium mesarthrocarpum]